MPKLRQATFTDFDQVAEDIVRLGDAGYEAGGKWNLSQICRHLTATMRAGMNGGIRPMPWLFRATIGKAMTEYIIRTGRMPSGYQAPDLLQPIDMPADDEQSIEVCLNTLAQARDFPGPIHQPHPFCQGLTTEKWKRLMLVHSGHHLSFLAPKAY